MKKSKFVCPYDTKGHTPFNIKKISKSGVYVIKKNGKIIYVGMSKTNTYKTLYRHFQIWNDNREFDRLSKNPYSKYYERVTYYTDANKKNNFRDFTVRVILCTPKQAERLEKLLIIKHKPKDNTNKYIRYNLDKYDKTLLDIYGNAIEEPPF